jgi:hypothetical protein
VRRHDSRPGIDCIVDQDIRAGSFSVGRKGCRGLTWFRSKESRDEVGGAIKQRSASAIGGFQWGGSANKPNSRRDDTTTLRLSAATPSSSSILNATAPPNRPVMPPRLPLGAPRAISSSSSARVCIRLHRRFASSSADAPEVYDVVCVGGGPAGLSLLAGLKASPVTNGLKVALIEGQDLQKNRLQKDASLVSFSNRCSSLTPASVKNLQGT